MIFVKYKSLISFLTLFFLCNICLASSGSSFAESAVIGFLTFPLFFVFLFISFALYRYLTKKKQDDEQPISVGDDYQEFEKNDPLITLKSLLDSGVFTEAEYNQRVEEYKNKLELKQKKLKEDSDKKLFEKMLAEKTKHLIALVETAKNDGVITETEFEKKKYEIIKKYTEEVKFILSHKPKLSDIKFSEKSIVNKDKLELLLEEIQPNDLIVETPSGQFQIITTKEWREIRFSDKANYYKLVAEYKVPKKDNS